MTTATIGKALIVVMLVSGFAALLSGEWRWLIVTAITVLLLNRFG